MEFPTSISAVSGSLHFSSAFTADELEVAGILLDLSGKVDLSSRFPAAWGAKRKRSVIDAPPVTGKSDYSSTSPNSPLVFSSLADSDSNRLLPKTFQTKKDELLMDLERLTETRDYLKLEVKRRKLSRDELMAENMKLRETEQLMHERVSDVSDPLELRLMSQSEPSAQSSGVSQWQPVGPKGIIPDLNVPAEECPADLERPQPSDLDLQLRHPHQHVAAAAKGGADAAALARQHRRLIQMNKRARRGSR